MATTKGKRHAPGEENGQPLQIAELRISDFMAIRFLKVDDAGDINIVSGDNGTGKTSTLEAIRTLLQPAGFDIEVIRDDAECAELYARFTNGLEATRKITPKNNRLNLRAGDDPIAEPQTTMDSLIGRGKWHDVLQVAFAKPFERREWLLGALDVRLREDWLMQAMGDLADCLELTRDGLPVFDWSKNGLLLLKDMQSQVYQARAEVNRDVLRVSKAIEQARRNIPATTDAAQFVGFEPAAARAEYEAQLSAISEAEGILNAHRAKETQLQQQRDRNRQLTRTIEDGEEKITRSLEQIVRLREQIAQIDQDILNQVAANRKTADERDLLVQQGLALKNEIDSFQAPNVTAMRQEAAQITAKLNAFDSHQEIKVTLRQIEANEAELEIVTARADRLDAAHKRLIEDVPQLLMQQSEMPVEGLTIGDDDIRIQGRSLSKLSDGERMEACMEIMAFLQQPQQVRIILVNGIERMVGELRKRFFAKARELARKYGVQFWMTQTVEAPFHIEKETV